MAETSSQSERKPTILDYSSPEIEHAKPLADFGVVAALTTLAVITSIPAVFLLLCKTNARLPFWPAVSVPEPIVALVYGAMRRCTSAVRVLLIINGLLLISALFVCLISVS